MPMDDSFDSAGLTLAAHVARPARAAAGPLPALVLCHGFPAGPGGAATSAQTYPEFADHLASETGWTVLTFNFRGTGASQGDFSMAGWLDDLRAAVAHVQTLPRVSGVWLAGSSAGGVLAICLAGEDESIRGVATLAAPADFDRWASDPGALLRMCREVGVVRDAAFPPDLDAWAQELRETQPLSAISKIPPRPLLLVHGTADDVVSLADARALADAAGESADLRVVAGAGHRLRHDPRAVAVLIGWMERQEVG